MEDIYLFSSHENISVYPIYLLSSFLPFQAAKKLEDLTGQKCLPVKMDVRKVLMFRFFLILLLQFTILYFMRPWYFGEFPFGLNNLIAQFVNMHIEVRTRRVLRKHWQPAKIAVC